MNGVVELDGVWVDDRRRCTWGLCDVSLVATPGTTTALIAPADQGAADAVFDLLTGRRLPVRGRVVVDGIDLRDLRGLDRAAAITLEIELESGERRLTIAGETTLLANPTPDSLVLADEIIEFDAGFRHPVEVAAAAG